MPDPQPPISPRIKRLQRFGERMREITKPDPGWSVRAAKKAASDVEGAAKGIVKSAVSEAKETAGAVKRQAGRDVKEIKKTGSSVLKKLRKVL